MGEKYRYIGKPMLRRDAAEIVTGSAQYLDDLRFPNLLHGKVLRSPHAHAAIKKIDKSRAEALPGVMAVVTWEDIPDWRGGTPRNVRVLDKKVRFVGDAVALGRGDNGTDRRASFELDRGGVRGSSGGVRY